MVCPVTSLSTSLALSAGRFTQSVCKDTLIIFLSTILGYLLINCLLTLRIHALPSDWNPAYWIFSFLGILLFLNVPQIISGKFSYILLSSSRFAEL